jgi:hypothetical protein
LTRYSGDAAGMKDQPQQAMMTEIGFDASSAEGQAAI